MKLFPAKRMYVPALTIVGVAALLLLTISISTFRNLHTEKTKQMGSLLTQGTMLIKVLEAGERAGMLMPMWGQDEFEKLIIEIGKLEDVEYIYLVNKDGTVGHHSAPDDQKYVFSWNPTFNDNKEILTQVVKKPEPNARNIFEIAKKFTPDYSMPPMMNHKMMKTHIHEDTSIVVGLSMKQVEIARKSDVQHALIMAAIVLALGTGTLFFIFVIQNYYLVDKTLKQTRDYTQQLISSMANGLMSIDTKGMIISYNNVALELLDIKESDLANNKDLRDIISFEKTGIIQTLENNKKIFDREVVYLKKAGDSVPLSWSSTPIESENKRFKGAVILIRDLSEIKELQERVHRTEKLAMVGSLSASVAHEIRNPLSSIKGFAQFLGKSFEEGTQQSKYSKMMVKEVDRINGVVNDLLTFARPMSVVPSLTDVESLLNHVVSLVTVDAKEKNVEVQYSCSTDLKSVELDENQITQVLLNLLINALNAVDEKGDIKLHAGLINSGKNLIIEVEDDGSGVPNKLKKKIFDPFLTTREKGTGLGLAIVKKIVDNHGGTISVASPPLNKDRGSIFTINLPIAT